MTDIPNMGASRMDIETCTPLDGRPSEQVMIGQKHEWIEV
jgi:hypothetical protein